jgi:heme-degrading monooxygenase HmoA
MFVRLVRFSFGPGKQDRAEQLARTLVPAIEEQKGCKSVIFFGDHAAGDYGVVVLWTTEEDANAAARVIRPQLDEGLAGNVQGPPETRLFQAIESRP